MFRPYAKYWLGPLLQLVVSGNNGGVGIHFMVVDVVVTVLSWTSLATPKVGHSSIYECEHVAPNQLQFSYLFIFLNATRES